MNYLDELTPDEMQIICASIPHGVVINYFKKNSKQFSKIRPGFRPTAVSPKDTSLLLFKNINSGFISSFIQKTIDLWLGQIQDSYESYLMEGKNETSAIVHTLSQSYFADNVKAYFKLVKKNYTDEQILLISDLVYDYRNTKQQIEELNNKVKEFKTTINNMELDAKKKDVEKKKIQNKLQQTLDELEELRKLKYQFENLSLSLDKYKEKMTILEKHNNQQKEQNNQLLMRINEVVSEKEALENDMLIRMEYEKKKKISSKVREFSLLRPNDMVEFQENLSYIFEDLGIGGAVPGSALLKKYLANILFCGIPIITSEQSGLTLAKCVANALIGTQEVSLLRYNPDISEENIMDFLSESKRVVLLDNFIGNYNETLLFPIIKMYGDKIIFMTMAYERTLNYISSEFLKYCSYINVDNFGQLIGQVKINEDPLTVNEESYSIEVTNKQSRHLKVLNKILSELSLEYLSTSVKFHDISNDDNISAELIYNILPYCIHVCNKQPLKLSETLQKYMSRCPHNALIGEWFADE